MKFLLSFRSVSAVILFVAVVLAGCSSSDTAKYARPKYNLLDSVNTEADEIAPFIDNGELYFTSNREESEDIWRTPERGDGLTAKFGKAAKDSGDFSALLSQGATNDGTIAFLTPNSGFFASGHAFDSVFAARFQTTAGGILGGTDLFGFTRKDGKITVENLRPLNSQFWDAHPAAAQREDTVLLIFASDRPDPSGASSPFKGQKAITAKGDTVEGNTDLFYAFRINGKWSAPRNMMTAPGGVAVNSSKFEYSPFLYCIDQRPTLLFAGDRSGDMDIYQADLDLNFGKQFIAVKNCVPLALGRDSINMSASNERFPFVPYPHGGDGSQALYIASDRYAAPAPTSDGQMMKSFGGYDLYRFSLPTQCRAPIVQYRVVVLDGENNMRPVKNPVIELVKLDGKSSSFDAKNSASLQGRALLANTPAVQSQNGGDTSVNAQHTQTQGGGTIIRSTENPALFTLEWGKKYMTFGGSLWDKIECDPAQLAIGRTIGSYVSMNFSAAAPRIESRNVGIEIEKITGGSKIVISDTTLKTDTLNCETLGEISAKQEQSIKSVAISGGNILVTRALVNRREEITGGRRITETVRETRYDTIPRFDTSYIKTTERLTPSNLSKAGIFPASLSANDTVITDTVIIYPKYYEYPLCEWVFTRAFKDYRKNVPYFQTGFWEVNTSKNFGRHIEMFSDNDAYKGASFIELHPSNQYFGSRLGMTNNQREGRKLRRERRKVEYRHFADTVDRNLRKMAESIADDILPSLIELNAKSPEQQSKLIVQIAAYSDARVIKRGDYRGSEKIEYVSGHYDEERKEITAKDVSITPGESMIGANNDVLSKLRAWFGYRELLALLRQNTLFEEMLNKGEIVLPQDITASDFRRKCENAKVIIVIEGRQVDEERKAKVQGYAGEDNDYYSLDDVRRIDVQVNRIQWQNGKILAPPCCVSKTN
ncbi:hypothetical protein MASR2M18_09660 [Ignavibacteria bacterium]|nr:hypothetical protein [Bacteroidota bacterium]